MDLKVISGKNVLFLVVPKKDFIFHMPRKTCERISALERTLTSTKTTTVSFKNN